MNSRLYIIVRLKLAKGELGILAPLIQEFFEKEVSTVAGFVSARLHANAAGTILINCATWESEADFQYFVERIVSVSETAKKIQAFAQQTDRVFEIPL